jgi:hypothetical protein
LAALAVTAGCSSSSSSSLSSSGGGGAPTRLAFVQGPASPVEASIPVAPTVTVAVVDAAGHVATTSTAIVSLALGANPNGATLSGTTSTAAVQGLASFPGLSVNMLGTGLTLTASSTGLLSATTTFNVVPELGTPIALEGVTTITQKCPLTDPTGGEPFPLHANTWDIDVSMTLNDGWDDQWDPGPGGDGPSSTSFTGPGTLNVGGTDFPDDQTFGELTFSTPIFTSADGLVAAAVTGSAFAAPLAGTMTAYLNALADARLQQTINLTGAVTPVNLTWTDQCGINTGGLPGDASHYQVVIRDTNGNLLFTAATALTVSAATRTVGPVSLPVTLTGTIVLSFEQRSTPRFGRETPAWTAIDNVSLKDNGGAGAERIVNGTFETGDLTGWASVAPGEPQNFTSGVRTFGNIQVTRSFYTAPGALWSRFTDTYTNMSTTAAVTTTAVYTYNQGSDGGSEIYSPTGSALMGVSSWDTTTGDRDIGLVFGSGATSVSFSATPTFGLTTAPAPAPLTSGDDIRIQYNLSIPANGVVTIVHFPIQDGIETAQLPGVTDLSARATVIDQQVLTILQNVRKDPQYLRGLTQEQYNTLLNY